MTEFIPYLDLELDFMLALKALADNKDSYLASRPYLDPVKWNKAYADLMSRGITGVTLNNGNYEIQHNGLDFIDPEGYYGDVAHYIQSTLAGVTPRLKEEPKKLPIFDSEAFENDFGKHVTTKYYGGRKETADAEWNLLDKPDKYGIRKTDERKARLIEALKSYKDSLLNRDNEYSFEGSPFNDMNDVRARLDAAIKALESPEPDDDRKALNALGWTQDKWLKTGENEPWKDTGMTALEARNAEAAALLKLELEKLKKNLLNISQIRNNISNYKKYNLVNRVISSGYSPDLSRHKNLDLLLKHLKEKYSTEKYLFIDDNLRKDRDEIITAYKLLLENKKLKPIGDLLYKTLSKSKHSSKLNKNNLYLLEGLEDIVYDSLSNLIFFLKYKLSKEEDALSRQANKDAIKKYLNYALQYRFKQGGILNKSIDIIINNFLKDK